MLAEEQGTSVGSSVRVCYGETTLKNALMVTIVETAVGGEVAIESRVLSAGGACPCQPLAQFFHHRQAATE